MTATIADPATRRTTRQGEITAHPGGLTSARPSGEREHLTLTGEVLAPSW